MQGNYEIQSKYNQRRTFEAFVTPTGEVRGNEIHHIAYLECIRRFDVSYEFAGKAVTIWIVSHDRRIDRSIALHLATAIALDKVRKHTIDTSSLVGFFTQKKKGK